MAKHKRYKRIVIRPVDTVWHSLTPRMRAFHLLAEVLRSGTRKKLAREWLNAWSDDFEARKATP